MGITMGSTIDAFRQIALQPSGAFTDLGAKRGVSVLWKAIRGKDVQSVFHRNTARKAGHSAVSSALNQGQFTDDFAGLRDLLATARKCKGQYKENPITDQLYRVALFDAAWNNTIGKNKRALRQWDVQNKTMRHDRVRSALRQLFARSETNSVDKALGGIARYGYLPRFEAGPNSTRTRRSQDVADDLRPFTEMPNGVYAQRGTNYREYDTEAKQLLAPTTVDVRECFSIEPADGAIAVSFSSGKLDACRQLNQDLLSDPQAVELPDGAYGFIVKDCGSDFYIKAAAPTDGEWHIKAFVPPTATADGGFHDLADHKLGITLPKDTLIVAVSTEAAAAIRRYGPIPPETMSKILVSKNPAGDLQAVLSEMAVRSTKATIERKRVGLRDLEQLGYLFKQVPPGKVHKSPLRVEQLNNVLAGIDAVEVPADASEADFQTMLQFFYDYMELLRECLTRPIGGDMLILVMSPEQALPSRTPAPPPPIEGTDDDEYLFSDEALHDGGTVLKLKKPNTTPPPDDKGKERETETVASSEESLPENDIMDFDLAHYV